MSDDDRPPIPPDHPIHELWRNNELLRTIPGTIELAKSGDAYAARLLLQIFQHQTRNLERDLKAINPRHPIQQIDMELFKYFCECFAHVLAGENADAALHLTTGTKGRRKRTADQIEQKAMLGYHVALCLRDNPELSQEAAFAETAERFHVSTSTARDAYREYMRVSTI